MPPIPSDDAGPDPGPDPGDTRPEAPSHEAGLAALRQQLRQLADSTREQLAGLKPLLGRFARRSRERLVALKPRLVRLVRSRRAWAAALGLLVLTGIGWQRCGMRGCPAVGTLASYQPGGASLLIDRNGETIASLGPAGHAMVEIESLPEYVPAAFIAVEDKRFYSHRGVDWRRVFGAGLANLKAGSARQGSSTITMQLSRNLFPDRIRAREKTFRRKLLEVRVARSIERRFTKDEILELYLNHIYFGSGAYGIEAAARQYFDRSASKLTLEQAATLAALPKAPSHYDPRRQRDAARDRRDLVLALMADQGRISPAEAEEAQSKAMRVASARNRKGVATRRAPYFVDYVRDLLEDRLGEDLYSRPLRIYTTLDLRAQKVVEEELEKQIRRVEGGAFGRFAGPTRARHEPGATQTEYLQGSAVVLDHETGDVLAMVGGRDINESTFNRAVDARRQAGSSFKPFVYATALSRGWSPGDILDDSPYRLVSGGQTWEPRNADGEFVGPVTVREALVYSRNVPSVRLAERVGVGRIVGVARAAGIRGDMSRTPAIALGVAEVSPLELTAGYTAFSGLGEAVRPRMVLRVEDPDGRVLWAPEVERKRVIHPATAYMMTDLLRDVVDYGTGRHVRYAGYRGLAAGKTGTTNEGADTWFVGYTPRLTAGVWIGFDQPRPITDRASGGPIAAQAWGRMMNRMPETTGRSDWYDQPKQVVEVAIDPESGLALEEGCAPVRGEPRTELFMRGREPDTVCPDARPGPSLADRIASRLGSWWDGFFGDRPVHVASNDDGDRRNSRDRDDGDNRRSDRWSEDIVDALEEAIERRAEERDHLIDWLENLSDAVDDVEIRPRDARRIQGWIDGAIRSIRQLERAARERDERNMERWMEGVIDRLGGENLRPSQRRELERDLLQAARELQLLE